MDTDNGVSSCDICTMKRSRQTARRKKAIHDINAPFQAMYAELMGTRPPAAPRGFRYMSKITDLNTKWKVVHAVERRRVQ